MIGQIFKFILAAVVIGLTIGVGITLCSEGYYPGAILSFLVAIAFAVMALPFVLKPSGWDGLRNGQLVKTSGREIIKAPLYKQPLLAYLAVKIFGRSGTFVLPDESQIFEGKYYAGTFFVTHAAYKVKPEYELTDKYGKKVRYVTTIYSLSDALWSRLFGDPAIMTCKDGITSLDGYIFGEQFYIKNTTK